MVKKGNPMKTSLYLLLILLPSSLYSVLHQHLMINNQSENPISIFYNRADPGFLGNTCIITENIIVEHNETIEIATVIRKSKDQKGYTLIKCINAHEKEFLIKLNQEKTTIKILKDEAIEAS